MIIDTHSHWLPARIIENAHFFHKGWMDADGHIAVMRQCKVDKAVLTYPTSDAHLKLGSSVLVSKIFNDGIAQLVKQYPDFFIGACVLPVGDINAMLEEYKRVRDLGFKAISLASSYNGVFLDDEALYPLYEEAQKTHTPIFVHSQIVNPIGYSLVNDPLLTPVIEYVFDITMCIGKMMMAGVFTRFSDVPFVFANFGGAIPFLQHRFDATYTMLRGINFVKDLGKKPSEILKNVYVDIGGDRTKSNFLLALELFGPEHILWGSDWPAKKDVSGSIQSVHDLDILAQDKEKILGTNAARLLKQVSV